MKAEPRKASNLTAHVSWPPKYYRASTIYQTPSLVALLSTLACSSCGLSLEAVRNTHPSLQPEGVAVLTVFKRSIWQCDSRITGYCEDTSDCIDSAPHPILCKRGVGQVTQCCRRGSGERGRSGSTAACTLRRRL